MNVQASLLLLADSQLLFHAEQQLAPVRHWMAGRVWRAAYVGAANGNRPEFFQLAEEALTSLVGRPMVCDFITHPDDVVGVSHDLIILAGGSVSVGWAFLQQSAVMAWLHRAALNPDALFIGVSAGAIHLGQGCDPEAHDPVMATYLNWFPHFIAVHEEQVAWPSREVWRVARQTGEFCPLPLGGGLWVQGGQAICLGKQVANQF